MSTMTGKAKPCQRCGRDVRGRPGVEVGPGKFVCSACLEPGEAEDIGPLELELPDEAFLVETVLCPACDERVAATALKCPRCKWDLAAITARPRSGPRPCPHCGFDRAGYDGRRCPRCRKKVEQPSADEWRAEESAAMGRREWTGVVWSVLGGVISAAVIAELTGLGGLFAYVATVYAVTMPMAWLGLVLASLAWIPVETPLGLSFGKMAAVYGLHLPVMMLMLAVMQIVPFLPLLVVFGAYLGLLIRAFDLEWHQAVGLALSIAGATGLVSWALAVVTQWAL